MEYNYWKITYISCEGNERWFVAKTPLDWERWQVEDRIQMGGCGDEPAEIISIDETMSDDYAYDYTE